MALTLGRKGTETHVEQRRVRILIADDQALFREAVRTVLEVEEDLQVVAEAGTELHAVAEAERARPDVAIVDSRLPGGGGLVAAREIIERVPSVRILILSGQDHERAVVDAIEGGVTGFMTKESALSELIEAVRSIVRGETVVPTPLLGPLLSELLHRRHEQDQALERISRLTPREMQVLRLLVGGADNEAIGGALRISPQTARTHVQNILAKLQVHSRLEAAALVTKQGVLDHLSDDPLGSWRPGADSRRKWRASDLNTALG